MTIGKSGLKLTKSSKTEQVIRHYHCTEMVLPRCDGYLAITNKRLIFHGLAGEGALDSFIQMLLGGRKKGGTSEPHSRIVSEIDIKTISGVASYYGRNTNMIMLLIGCAMILASLILMFGNPFVEPTIIGIAVLALGAWLIYKSRRKTFFLNILSSASESAFSIGAGIGNFGGLKPVLALIGCPTDETDEMMREIGAIISDINELGDMASELWAEKGRLSFRKTKAA